MRIAKIKYSTFHITDTHLSMIPSHCLLNQFKPNDPTTGKPIN